MCLNFVLIHTRHIDKSVVIPAENGNRNERNAYYNFPGLFYYWNNTPQYTNPKL